MTLGATIGTLLSAMAAHGVAEASNPQTMATGAAHGGDCFSKAYAAAHRAYRQHYKSDWYVRMRAVVQQNQVTEVELNLGPHDGSVGGGIVARYRCLDRTLVTLKYER